MFDVRVELTMRARAPNGASAVVDSVEPTAANVLEAAQQPWIAGQVVETQVSSVCVFAYVLFLCTPV